MCRKQSKLLKGAVVTTTKDTNFYRKETVNSGYRLQVAFAHADNTDLSVDPQLRWLCARGGERRRLGCLGWRGEIAARGGGQRERAGEGDAGQASWGLGQAPALWTQLPAGQLLRAEACPLLLAPVPGASHRVLSFFTPFSGPAVQLETWDLEQKAHTSL